MRRGGEENQVEGEEEDQLGGRHCTDRSIDRASKLVISCRDVLAK